MYAYAKSSKILWCLSMNMELTKDCKQDASQKEQFTSDGYQQTPRLFVDTPTRSVTVSDSSQMLGGGRELAGLIPEAHQ